MAAVFAKNTTTLKNVSLEPEVLDVISFLNNSSNSKFIKFTGKRTLQIKGITKLIKGLSINTKDNSKIEDEVRKEVVELCSKFPIYKHLR